MKAEEAIKLFRNQKKYQSFVKFLTSIEDLMVDEEEQEFLDADLCPEVDKDMVNEINK